MAGERILSDAATIAHQLVRSASVTGTPGEAAFAPLLAETITSRLAAEGRRAETRLIASHGDPVASSVAALVRGKGSRCVVLAGHFDVVSIENFGKLQPLAFEPEALSAALIAESEADGVRDCAWADLHNGDFVPGRGMLDMKSGLAAGIVALERFAASGEAGNVLFMATPDEENRSRGMRSMRDALGALADEWDLEIVGGINLDATDDDGDGSAGRSMFFGTVGKYSPFAYVVGVPTHAGYPFGGYSVHGIGAEILRAVEYNDAFVDTAHGETSPPPVCLEARDFRESYNVTTPDRSWISFNWLSHSRQPDELFELFCAEVRTAVDRALSVRRARAERSGVEIAASSVAPVLTVAQLFEKLSATGAENVARFEALALSLADEGSPLTASQTLIRHLVDAVGLAGPAVVTGFSSLYYPAVHVDDPAFRATVETAATKAAARHATTISTREFFPGISDMSFLGTRADPRAAATINTNALAPQMRDSGCDTAPVFPVVNIGPWGRDCHKKHERVHAHYAFEVLPDIVSDVVSALLAQQVDAGKARV